MDRFRAGHRTTLKTLLAVLLLCEGCGGNAAQRDSNPNPGPMMRDAGKDPQPPGSARGTESPAPRTAPSGPMESDRGNTPPGQDRSGLGPASGAIRDPSGVATDTPVKGGTR